jgi:hypothetical protein
MTSSITFRLYFRSFTLPLSGLELSCLARIIVQIKQVQCRVLLGLVMKAERDEFPPQRATTAKAQRIELTSGKIISRLCHDVFDNVRNPMKFRDIHYFCTRFTLLANVKQEAT